MLQCLKSTDNIIKKRDFDISLFLVASFIKELNIINKRRKPSVFDVLLSQKVDNRRKMGEKKENCLLTNVKNTAIME